MCLHQTVSAQEKTAQASQAALFDTLTNQAQQVFGAASQVFKSLFSAYAPIVAAGPNQEGYSVAQMSNLISQAVTSTGIAARNAMSAVKGAFTGSNLPSGAAIGAQLATANAAAQSGAQMQSNIRQQSAEIGRQNFFAASQALAGTPNVFNPATSAGGAATGAGQASDDTAKDITAVQNAPGMGMGILGAIGGVLGGAVAPGGLIAGMLGGGVSKGLGFISGGSISPTGTSTVAPSSTIAGLPSTPNMSNFPQF